MTASPASLTGPPSSLYSGCCVRVSSGALGEEGQSSDEDRREQHSSLLLPTANQKRWELPRHCGFLHGLSRMKNEEEKVTKRGYVQRGNKEVKLKGKEKMDLSFQMENISLSFHREERGDQERQSEVGAHRVSSPLRLTGSTGRPRTRETTRGEGGWEGLAAHPRPNRGHLIPKNSGEVASWETAPPLRLPPLHPRRRDSPPSPRGQS